MDQVASSDEHPSLFTAEELKGIDVTESGKDFIEVDCGCTHRRYGDTAGKLRVFGNGKVEIACDCYQGCKGAKLSPSEFEKHAGVTGMSNWRVHVWVFVDGKKVQLKKTKLLKYHKGSASDPSTSVRPRRSRTTHRDELVACTACGKERRFYRRDQDECKIHHHAATNKTWTCSDYFYEDITCENEEERASKKRFRGCPRRPVCKGCTSCVCFGCSTCRFEDCDCRACVDFIQNAEPKD